MRLTGNHIIWLWLICGYCAAEDVAKNVTDKTDSLVIKDPPSIQTEEDNASVGEASEQDENLPILPPIILLDFGNGTESNGDEKSKRTIDGSLGYGINRNSFFSGKNNYYFPAGKTGTTVSIEESISPFLPKTIIERVPSSTARPLQSSSNNLQRITAFSDASNYQYQYFQTPHKTQNPYGRTKLQKVPNASYGSQQGVSSTTQSPIYYSTPSNFRNSVFVSSTTPAPQIYAENMRYDTPQPNPASYYQQHVKSQLYGGRVESSTTHPYYDYVRNSYFAAGQAEGSPYLRNSPLISAAAGDSPYTRNSPLISVSSSDNDSIYSKNPSTPSPLDRTPYSGNAGIANIPKYTVENGVRYENKIYWKYPDGRVTDMAPPTYVETYSNYGSASAGSGAAEQSKVNNKPGISDTINYEVAPGSNVNSQGPVQFPNVPGGEQEPNYFISSESLATNPLHQHVYRLGYQSLVGQRSTLAQQAKKSNSPSQSSSSSSSSRYTSAIIKNKKNQKTNSASNVTQRPASRYMVNSPNPEYTDTYTTQSPVKETTPISQQYSTPAPVQTDKMISPAPEILNNYSNLGYSDLLKYNPSISQYVRNPSSIRNVQPTFVQAGNSVIPVIILRVDGTSPVQPKETPNVNLKALLQQYLLQYANNVQELAEPSNYDFGGPGYDKSQSPIQSGSPVLDLAGLTQDGIQGSYDSSYYSSGVSYDTSRGPEADKKQSAFKFGDRTTKRQKVKNVQIVEDPRYPPY